ncbi:hypothetical protein CEP65_017840 [Enterobacter hormaechei]|nr:hypothetical protein CEP65_017840 [Enterobacter hormaechei]
MRRTILSPVPSIRCKKTPGGAALTGPTYSLRRPGKAKPPPGFLTFIRNKFVLPVTLLLECFKTQ